MKQGLWLVVGLSLLVSACTSQKRPDQFVQGQGEGLDILSAYDGKTELILTGMALSETEELAARSKEITRSEVKVQVEKDQMHSFPLVKYEIKTVEGNNPAKSLLDSKILLRGRPNHQYQALYRLTDSYLKIFKVGAAKDIDTLEQTYAEKLPDGRLAVPVIGYPVKYFRLEHVRNSDNEKTNNLSQFSSTREKASHMEVDFNAGELFTPAHKGALFKADYFHGDWFFSATVIAAPEEKGSSIGFGGATDQNFNSSERIKFVKSEGFLKAVNVNIDARLAKTEDSNFATAVAIPVKWKAFRTAQKSNENTLREEEVSSISWEDRSHLEFDLDNTKSPVLQEFVDIDMSSLGSKVVGVEMTDEYFSFVLQQHDANIRVRFSFVRVGERKYQEKRYFSDDQRVFGFFDTKKAAVNNYERRRQEDIDKNIFINRFNPKKDIVFRFTKNSPDWLRPAIRESVEEWNKAFQAAGAQSKVLVADDFDVDLGDLRYNAINLIESLSEGNLFGFGPSVSDPYTGEIISATSNVHVTPIRSAIISEIQNYIRHKTGQLSGSYVPGVAALADSILTSKVVENASANATEITARWVSAAKKMVFNTTDDKGNAIKKTYLLKPADKNERHERDLSISSGNLHLAMETLCKEDLLPYIEDLKSTGQLDSDRELEVLNSCSRKLAVSKVQGTFIHELGHNLGLRHNFMASTDQANFWPVVHTKNITGSDKVVRSSSVMEYPAFNEDRLITPGSYDVEAIRFGYADAVKLKDGSIGNVNPKMSLAAQKLGKNIRHSFAYCTDEDAYLGSDPMCRRHDAGVTATEIVTNMIHQYNASVAVMNYRYDGLGIYPGHILGLARSDQFFYPMKSFYDKFRQVLAQTVSQKQWYFEDLTAEEVDKAMAELMRDPSKAKQVEDLRTASKLSFEFLKQIATLSDRNCVVQDKKTQKTRLVNLDGIRSKVFFTSDADNRELVTSCSHPSVAKAIDPSGETVVLGEDGYFMNNVRFDLGVENITKSFDIAGMGGDREWASQVLTDRRTMSQELAYVMDFAPSYMDSPQFRAEWQSLLEARLLRGLSTTGIKESIKVNQGVDVAKSLPDYALSYKSEETLLRDQFLQFMISLNVPKSADVSMRLKARYLGQGIPGHLIQSYLANGGNQGLIFQIGADYFAADEDAQFSKNLVQVASRLYSQSKVSPINKEDMAKPMEILAQLLPAAEGSEKVVAGEFMEILQAANAICRGFVPVVDPAKPEEGPKLPAEPNLELTNAQSGACLALFADSVDVFNEIGSTLSQLDGNKEEDKTKLIALLNKPMKDILSEKKREYTLTRESLDSRLDKVIEMQKAMQQDYLSNRDEHDAKSNLLTTLMRILM
jgi:hypothetical protein